MKGNTNEKRLDTDRRKTSRFDHGRVAEPLRKVRIILDKKAFIEARVVNLCSLGMRLSIPAGPFSGKIPEQNETVKICLPESIILTSICMYVTNNQDDSISMGLYFPNPNERNYLNDLLSELFF